MYFYIKGVRFSTLLMPFWWSSDYRRFLLFYIVFQHPTISKLLFHIYCKVLIFAIINERTCVLRIKVLWNVTFQEELLFSRCCSWTAWPLSMNARRSFQTSVTIYPTTRRHIPEDNRCENIRSCVIFYSQSLCTVCLFVPLQAYALMCLPFRAALSVSEISSIISLDFLWACSSRYDGNYKTHVHFNYC